MPRDGNCLFHSIAAIEGGVLDQSTYRKEVADEIWSQDNAWFACYIAPDWSDGREAYCRYIAQDGHWGGEQEIALLAARLEIEVCTSFLDCRVVTNQTHSYGCLISGWPSQRRSCTTRGPRRWLGFSCSPGTTMILWDTTRTWARAESAHCFPPAVRDA